MLTFWVENYQESSFFGIKINWRNRYTTVIQVIMKRYLFALKSIRSTNLESPSEDAKKHWLAQIKRISIKSNLWQIPTTIVKWKQISRF